MGSSRGSKRRRSDCITTSLPSRSPTSSPALLGASWLTAKPSRPARFSPHDSTRIVETPCLPRSARGLKRDGGSVFPAHANTGDPHGPEHERLQSKAGYIDARPHIRQLDESSLATHGRTIHVGQTRRIDTLTMCPPCPLHIR